MTVITEELQSLKYWLKRQFKPLCVCGQMFVLSASNSLLKLLTVCDTWSMIQYGMGKICHLCINNDDNSKRKIHYSL